MKKLAFILAVLFTFALGACTGNQQKEQVNDESTEIDAQSEEMGEDINENDPNDLGGGYEETETDTAQNGAGQDPNL